MVPIQNHVHVVHITDAIKLIHGDNIAKMFADLSINTNLIINAVANVMITYINNMHGVNIILILFL